MKKIVCCVVLSLCLLCTGAFSEQSPLSTVLQEHAQQQARYLMQIVQNEVYLEFFLNVDPSSKTMIALREVDFAHPQKMAIFIPTEEWTFDPAQLFVGEGLDMQTIDPKALISYVAKLTIESSRFGDLDYLLLSRFTAIDSALLCNDLNGIAYVIQLFGEESPLVVTAVATTEYPAAISYTSFLYNDQGMEKVREFLCVMIARFGSMDYDIQQIILGTEAE